MPEPTIPQSECASRRAKLQRKLKNRIGLVFAGDADAHIERVYEPHPNFAYLTGVTDEAGAILLLDPGNPIEARREVLFLRPLNPEVEKWDGFRLEVSKALRDATGFTSIFRTNQFGRFLLEAARRAKQFACLHALAQHDQSISPDRAVFRQLAERIPETEITDLSDALPALRTVKSAREVAMLQRAIDITAAGFDAVFKSIAPGMNEFDVQETLEHTYRTGGSRRTSFATIAGSGINSTVLHYGANDKVIKDGDLICIDSGARFGPIGGAYCADITRTIPANGIFTKRQREIYNTVLNALEAATKATKPGVTLTHLDKVARAVITKAGFGDYFIHSIGHHLGMETHDVNPGAGATLKAGNVITIEPGIYIPDEAIGVRIEDDVLVTKDSHRVLSKKIPRTAAAIEKAIKR